MKEIQKHIVAGDLIQAVPSRRTSAETEVGALEVYRRLRSVNPSPTSCTSISARIRSWAFAGEPRAQPRRKSSIRPIAGTCRRGKNEAEDEFLKESC